MHFQIMAKERSWEMANALALKMTDEWNLNMKNIIEFNDFNMYVKLLSNKKSHISK